MTGRARRATRPTSCHFGAALVRSPLVLRADIERRGALALHRSGERCSGMPRSRPGTPTGTRYSSLGKHGVTDSSADARDPMTSRLRRAIVLSDPISKRARSWAIERNEFADLTSPQFYLVISIRSCERAAQTRPGSASPGSVEPTVVVSIHADDDPSRMVLGISGITTDRARRCNEGRTVLAAVKDKPSRAAKGPSLTSAARRAPHRRRAGTEERPRPNKRTGAEKPR